MSLASTTLFEGELVRIRQVVCRPEDAVVGEEEQSAEDTLVLPGRGRFVQHLPGARQVLAEPTQALLFAANRPYRVSHPDSRGDDCLVLAFPEATRVEVLVTAAAAERFDDPGLRPQANLSPAVFAARALLWRRLIRGRPTALEVEESGLGLLACAVAAARPDASGRRGRRRGSSSQERALAVRQLLLQRPANPWRLRGLAARVYTTPFHLARLFREEVGIPVHQYHLRVRLAHALELLLDTRQTLSAIALACGFSSHSHFTATFHRLTGVAPARLRAAARGAGVREVRGALLGGAGGRARDQEDPASWPAYRGGRRPEAEL